MKWGIFTDERAEGGGGRDCGCSGSVKKQEEMEFAVAKAFGMMKAMYRNCKAMNQT